MTRASTLPVGAVGRDNQGLPTRLIVPGLTLPVPIVLAGRRLGEVARDGTVTWTRAGPAGTFWEFSAHVDCAPSGRVGPAAAACVRTRRAGGRGRGPQTAGRLRRGAKGEAMTATGHRQVIILDSPRRLPPGTSLRVWLDQIVENFGQRRAGPHAVGRAEVMDDGRLAMWFIEGTKAGREARAFVEDDALDVTVEGEPPAVWLRP
jgi:hypothetical protein